MTRRGVESALSRLFIHASSIPHSPSPLPLES